MQLNFATLEEYRQADSLPRMARLATYAALNRLNVLYMIQRAGSGHIGSSFSSMDIITYMLLEHPEIAFFSSKGHDAPAFYACLTGLGKIPFEMIHQLRRVGGLPGHPELRTPGMIAHSGSLGMGISKAKGLIRANRLRGIKQRVAVLLGDGELQEGQVWEALLQCDFEELTVIIDRNRLATEQEPRLGDLIDALEQFGTVVIVDGHSFDGLAYGLQVKANPCPLIIVANTIKGKGASVFEGQPQYHSGTVKEAEYNAATGEIEKQILAYLPGFWPRAHSMRVAEKRLGLIPAYAAALEQEGADKRVVVLDADLAVDCGLGLFRTKYPERFVECGIAEQDMVSQAGMLAAQGFIPIVHSFAAFLTRRANEQIYDNCHQGLKVIYVGTLAGRLPDGPGPSHEALEDVALMRTMPNMEMLEPKTAEEVSIALHYAVHQAEGPVYIRLAANPIERMRINRDLHPVANATPEPLIDAQQEPQSVANATPASSPLDLTDKHVVITGGSGFLGRQWIPYLEAQGAKVWNLDLPDVDVTDINSLMAVFDEMRRVDALICAAALDAKPGTDAPLDPWQNWDSIVNVNLSGVAKTVQVFAERMRLGGSIVLVGSMYGMVGPDPRRYENFVKPAAYSASKAGLYGLCRYLAAYLGTRGIRVNCVTFGAMASPSHPARFTESMRQGIPLGRLAEPGEWNGPIHFLVSDASSYMTGSNLVIDGGYSSW